MENKESLEELIKTIQDAELTEEVIQWMDNISAPEQKLISNLVATFNEKMDSDIEYSNSILQALA